MTVDRQATSRAPQPSIGAEKRAKLDLLEAEQRRRVQMYRHRDSLYEFVRYFWPVLEPETPLVEGWAMHAICVHLEAVAAGQVNRLLINVPPGFSKSLLCNVFFPAWLWGPASRPHLRMLKFSYAASLTERDNAKLRDLMMSPQYRELYGDRFELKKVGETKITNSKTGSALATSVGGVGTGERGDLVILDDPHSVKESESDAVRGETVRWFREALSNRLNDMERSAIIVIMQRVHEADVSGTILSEGLGYTHLMIPMEYDPGRHCSTSIGWTDPRSEDRELAWPERFPPPVVAELQSSLGPYAYAGQYQQSPAPRGGGIFQRDWWQLWADDAYPPLEFVLVSADTAYTEKESNDPSACTVWGLWRENGAPRIVLIYAWRKFLAMHGKYEPRKFNESTAEFEARTKPSWGLVEWLAWTCRRYKADKLIIEGKASGLTAVQEIQRLHGTEGWNVQVVQPNGDKVARAHAVQPVFSQLLVYAPDRDWADMVMDEMQSFPRGRYKDLTDSATQAMKFLREAGLIVHRHEIEYADQESRQYRRRSGPLYPA
jgi:predicted phage terminase large subunit-like protein